MYKVNILFTKIEFNCYLINANVIVDAM